MRLSSAISRPYIAQSPRRCASSACERCSAALFIRSFMLGADFGCAVGACPEVFGALGSFCTPVSSDNASSKVGFIVMFSPSAAITRLNSGIFVRVDSR